MSYYFTSEAVSKGHPDKVADQISDAILDNLLSQDPESRVACETMVTTGLAVIAGEVTTEGYVDVQKVARETVNGIGYNKGEYLFDGNSIGVMHAIHEQSPDIAMGVGKKDPKEQGAGDQGMMFGYAVKSGIDYMPLELMLSRMILERLENLAKVPNNHLRPDAKAQVTIEYDDNNQPLRVHTVLVSTQHDPFSEEWDKNALELIVKSAISATFLCCNPEIRVLYYNDKPANVYINPTGNFVIGGPAGDTGLTGRKIVVDTYGGRCPHGGGAFSGKDPSKVDRSAAYMCRYVAKNLVAAGVCDECTIQVSYAIGMKDPLSVYVNTHNTSHVDMTDGEIADVVSKMFDFTPYGIITNLKLKNPIYSVTAQHGPFGHSAYENNGIEYFTWEKLDRVNEIKKEFSI